MSTTDAAAVPPDPFLRLTAEAEAAWAAAEAVRAEDPATAVELAAKGDKFDLEARRTRATTPQGRLARRLQLYEVAWNDDIPNEVRSLIAAVRDDDELVEAMLKEAAAS